MKKKSSGLGYAIAYGGGLAALTFGAVSSFWAVTEGEVKRSAAEAVERSRVPEVWVDTTTPWQPEPEAALLDTLYMFREDGRLAEAYEVLERWLATHPDDRERRVDCARLAFEVGRRQRGVFHYRTYLRDGSDRVVLREAVFRILNELPPAEAREGLGTLLRVDDSRYTVRIALAKATADAGDPARADVLLDPIPPFVDPTVDELRLIVRRSLNPDVAAAQRWVDEYPDELHYRLVLARALVRDRRPAAALEHYQAAFTVDTTLALREEAADVALSADSLALASRVLAEVVAADSTRDGALLAYARVRARMGDDAGAVGAFERLMARNPDERRFAEARGVLFEVNDVRLTLPLLSRLVAFRPDDDALRLRFAQDLERTGDLPRAEAQYDTLILHAATAERLMARARLRAAQANLPGALADAQASEIREPGVEAALMQGDIHRWRQERELARQAYVRAAALAPDDPRVTEGRRLLAIQRRDALSYIPEYGRAASTWGLGDSDGFSAFTLRAQLGGAPLTSETVLLAGAEVRQASGAAARTFVGFGGDIGLVRPVGTMNLLAKLGAVAFSGAGTAPTASVELSKRSQTLSLRAAASHGPQYESLRAPATLAENAMLSGSTLLGSVSAQPGLRWDLYAQVDHTVLGDGNGRSVAAGAARYALTPSWGLLYTASVAGFGEGTVDYWSPSSFVTQGVGLDLRVNRPQGWSYGARVAPAYAWIRETAPGRPAGLQSALQGTVTGDATWRRGSLEIGLYAGYGQDRAGTYAAAFGGLRARLVP